MFWAAHEAGIAPFTDYQILGDDIVITNTDLAKSYQRIMVDILDVKINPSKTHISSDMFEFAKRIY